MNVNKHPPFALPSPPLHHGKSSKWKKLPSWTSCQHTSRCCNCLVRSQLNFSLSTHTSDCMNATAYHLASHPLWQTSSVPWIPYYKGFLMWHTTWMTYWSQENLKIGTSSAWRKCSVNCRRMVYDHTRAGAGFSSHLWSIYK